VAGTVIVPWYATGLRADGFGEALNEVAAAALRYGASSYGVYRARDDRYRFQQLASFDEHLDWDRYWAGPEMVDFRVRHSGWYQVPVVYAWWDLTARGGIVMEPTTTGDGRGDGRAAGNGHAHGDGHGITAGESA
jgi:hypothetical protein